MTPEKSILTTINDDTTCLINFEIVSIQLATVYGGAPMAWISLSKCRRYLQQSAKEPIYY